MTLSDEQMLVVNTGLEKNKEWSLLSPLDPKGTPDWINDVDIDWMINWSNPPRTIIHCSIDPFDYDAIWRREGNTYINEAPDGRARVLYHNGNYVTMGDGRRATTEQEGFGGRHFNIELEDGQLVLRGPWHGAPPPGFVEVHTKFGLLRVEYAGLYLREEAYCRAMAKFKPEIRLARCNSLIGVRVYPIHPLWDAPKGFTKESEK